MKLSIITVNYNNSEGLEKTLRSVFEQSFCDFEIIVIDGDSTDESVAICEKYQNKKSHFRYSWSSESDTGIYNAMNKGIKKASGEYLLFLNSGDSFCNKYILNNIFINSNINEDIIYGNRINCLNNKPIRTVLYNEVITLNWFFNNSLPHQATFIKRSLFDNCLYNEKNMYASDWEFFLYQIFIRRSSYRYIDIDIALYDISGISSTICNKKAMYEERNIIFEKLFPLYYEDYIKLNHLIKWFEYYDKKAEKIGKIILYPYRKIKSLCSIKKYQ